MDATTIIGLSLIATCLALSILAIIVGMGARREALKRTELKTDMKSPYPPVKRDRNTP